MWLSKSTLQEEIIKKKKNQDLCKCGDGWSGVVKSSDPRAGESIRWTSRYLKTNFRWKSIFEAISPQCLPRAGFPTQPPEIGTENECNFDNVKIIPDIIATRNIICPPLSITIARWILKVLKNLEKVTQTDSGKRFHYRHNCELLTSV